MCRLDDKSSATVSTSPPLPHNLQILLPTLLRVCTSACYHTWCASSGWLRDDSSQQQETVKSQETVLVLESPQVWCMTSDPWFSTHRTLAVEEPCFYRINMKYKFKLTTVQWKRQMPTENVKKKKGRVLP
ncbi:hypothetical protein Pmani_037459 [Petrolisthes manimaculis]|uniref:Uncharacterized protein n=1 Tax=Petrolisthes manimaculis TaxID=1843537 RepID=A0AAE1NI85_9EUCA|nr:hypothetical protein Pmani_037459 [Petrolisthes manimaculis]